VDIPAICAPMSIWGWLGSRLLDVHYRLRSVVSIHFMEGIQLLARRRPANVMVDIQAYSGVTFNLSPAGVIGETKNQSSN
jgi:hypothetical protein